MSTRLATLLLMVFPLLTYGQYGYITGKISDRFGPLENASIHIKDSPFGTFTDETGYFAFEIDTGYYELSIDLPGYHQIDLSIRLSDLEQKQMDIELESSLMDADVTIGTKSKVSQNQLESPVPIDVIYGQDLISTGQVELAPALHQLLPSFYSVKQSADDGINMVDPISLRGLGPDQVLVLINGKRRHKSAFLNVSDVFGKGTAGTDLNTIPILAVDRIEILRDGASSQYGSDAIAGVINIVLKGQSSDPTISVQVGESSLEDGESRRWGFNYGFRMKRRGFLNATAAYTRQDPINRGGNYTGPIFGIDSIDNNPTFRQFFFDRSGFPKETLVELGSSENENASLLLNGAMELTDNMDVYTTAGINFRLGKVNALYRVPGLSQQVDTIWHPIGFSPKLINEIIDRSIVLGVRGEVRDWYLDVSYGHGTNVFNVTVENSNNASLGILTPLKTFAGSYQYGHDIIGFDAARSYQLGSGQFDLAIGSEYRIEKYILGAGDPESYIDGGDTTALGLPKAVGFQGYIGVSEDDALEELRSNGSLYIEADYTLGKFLVSGALRHEEYSDFGSRNSYKVAMRHKFANQFILRTSYSSGFKAPSLQQIYYQRTSSQLIDQDFQNVALVNTETPIVGNILAIGSGLNPELSESASIGFTSSISRNISFSLDVFETDIRDRIGLVSKIDVAGDDLLSALYEGTETESVEFFTNLVDTKTSGIEAVLAAQYFTPKIAYHFNSSFSYQETTVQSTADLNNQTTGEDLSFSRGELSRIRTYVPAFQWRNSFSATMSKVTFTLNHTSYGSTRFLHPNDVSEANWVLNENTGLVETRDQKFTTKNIYGMDLTFQVFPKINLTMGGFNLTDQFPDRLTHSENVNNGLYKYSPNVRPFDLRGAYYYVRLDVKF